MKEMYIIRYWKEDCGKVSYPYIHEDYKSLTEGELEVEIQRLLVSYTNVVAYKRCAWASR